MSTLFLAFGTAALAAVFLPVRGGFAGRWPAGLATFVLLPGGQP